VVVVVVEALQKFALESYDRFIGLNLLTWPSLGASLRLPTEAKRRGKVR
jgi:hypothetical protein